MKRGPHNLECLLHPQKPLSFLLPQIHKDCFSKGGSKSTTLQQVPIKEGLIQSALKLIRDFLSLGCWGLDQTSVSEMVSVTRADILMQSLLQECRGSSCAIISSTDHSALPKSFKGKSPIHLFFTSKMRGSEVNSAKTHTSFFNLERYFKDISISGKCSFFSGNQLKKTLYSGQKKPNHWIYF